MPLNLIDQFVEVRSGGQPTNDELIGERFSTTERHWRPMEPVEPRMAK